MNREPWITFIDVFNSVAWFCMDGSWLMEWKETALGISVLVILSGVTLTVVEPDRKGKTAAVTSLVWMLMNTAWMVGDLYHFDALRIIAQVLFFCGAVLLFFPLKTKSVLVLKRFGRLRKSTFTEN